MPINTSRRRFAQEAAVMGLLPLWASCGSGDGSASEQDYRRTVEQVMSAYKLPGVLAGVRVAGEAPWTGAFGKANPSRGTPLALDSTFPIRSVTKSFTVTALLQLVRDGALALEDTIDTWVAGVPNGHLITLADLAGMQSGLVDYSSVAAFRTIFGGDPLHVWTEQDLVAFGLAANPTFRPGEAYQYSNTNTVLIGMVIEAVTQQTLAAAMNTRIFGPLALSGTAYPSQAALPAPAPTPYAVDVHTGVTEEQPLISPTSLAGSGAMRSTLADLLDWGVELGRGSLIGSTLQKLREQRSRVVTNGPEYERYGLGIGRIGNWWGHTGSGVGFQIATMNRAARGATIAVMVNATPVGSRRDLNFAQVLFEELAAIVDLA